LTEILAGVVQYRGYREGDLEALFRLDEACFMEPFRFSRPAMKRFAEAKRARVVIAEVDGELAGFCILHIELQVGYVVTLDVADAWRGRGLGRELMSRVEAEAREAGCEAVVLHVFVGNVKAIGFYDNVGFEALGKDAGFYGDGVDAWVYRKVIG
jgi:ribosomal-protein-alanine N-acetyltransferase